MLPNTTIGLAALLAVLTVGLGLTPAAGIDEPPLPNIVVVLTDDMRWDQLEGMPTVHFAATAASLARVSPEKSEGMDLLPLLEDPAAPWRTEFLVEHLTNGTTHNPVSIPSYCAVRDTRYLFVRYRTAEEELYDLVADPYELDNRAADPGLGQERRRLGKLARAMCVPRPPDGGPRF